MIIIAEESRPITIEEHIAKRPIPKGLKFVPKQKIIDVVTGYFEITFEQINIKLRKRTIRWPRQVIMYLLAKHTQLTLEAIGGLFEEDYHHTTVRNARQIVQDYIDVYDNVRCQIQEITEKLYE